MTSADVKSNIKQQEIKDLMAASYKLLEEITFKTSNSMKKLRIFHLILVGIPSILILSVKRTVGWSFFLLSGQNPLSVRKVNC